MRQTPSSSPIPRFFLYGDEGLARDVEFLHIEDIRSRSERYQWTIGSHTHPGLYQLVLLFSGEAELMLDGAHDRLCAPAAVIIPPGVVHAFGFRPGTDGHVLTLAPGMLSAGNRELAAWFEATLFQRGMLLRFDEGEEVVARTRQLLEQLEAEFKASERGRSQMVEWLAGAVLLLLARRQLAVIAAADAAERARSELFACFRALLEDHYAEHWPVSRYAEALHTTESTLNRLCRAVAACSAFELIQDRLVLEARRKLTYIAAPVAQLAYELGFQDPAYFCRFFRRRTGMTPSAFRLSRRAEGEGGAASL